MNRAVFKFENFERTMFSFQTACFIHIFVIKHNSTPLNKSLEGTREGNHFCLFIQERRKEITSGNAFGYHPKYGKEELTKSITKTKFQGKLANHARQNSDNLF